MRLPLIPREEQFFDMFVEDASNVLASARLLEEFFRNFDERERIAMQLRNAEHEGDRITHDIGHKLEATFVTPFDREEIHALINRLDDVLDLIEEVADTCILFGIDEPGETAVMQAGIVTLQCEQIVDALARLRKFKGLDRYWIGSRTRGTGSRARRSPSFSGTAPIPLRSSSGRTSTSCWRTPSTPARMSPTSSSGSS
jgi:uncharacterized protein Yka (UPF0111/DUF47 family)